MQSEDVVEPGRRERKKRATRNRICQAVLDLTARRNLDEITIDEIAVHADVSPRTFFNYFQSKEEALLATPNDWAERVEQLLLTAPEDLPPWQALQEAVLRAAADFGSTIDRQTMRRILAMDEMSVDQERMRAFVQMERRLIADVARRMAVDPAHDVRPALQVGAAVTGLRVAVSVWTTTEPEVPLLDVTRRCLDVLGGGLRAEHAPDRPGSAPVAP